MNALDQEGFEKFKKRFPYETVVHEYFSLRLSKYCKPEEL